MNNLSVPVAVANLQMEHEMQIKKLVLTAALCLAITPVQAAGFCFVEVPADSGGPALKAAVWSPCAGPSGNIQIGSFTLVGVRDCPVVGEKLPLIVVSHGFGGAYLGHHDTAEALADAGFIVVALNHPDDTACNKEKAYRLSALITRPDDVKRLLDFMLGPSKDAAKIEAQRIGFFGFSTGGYTGLVLAGAHPDFRELRSHCQESTGATCEHVGKRALPMEPVTHDTRIKAFVVADPLSSVFPTTDSLKEVTAPLQLWGSERGGDGASPENIAAVARNLPIKPDFHIVPNSGHFAFLTPCPAMLSTSLPELCTDSPGFDRSSFHKDFNTQVVAFFRKNL
jgi:predicted dienelactone hydrolase